MSDKQGQSSGCGWGCGAVILVLVLLCLFPKKREEGDEAEINALVNVESRIRADARSPASVRIPLLDRNVERKAGGYEIRSYFDAQNGFGSTIRTKYTATFDSEGNLKTIVYDEP